MRFLLISTILMSIIVSSAIQSSAQLTALRSRYIPFELPDELRIASGEGYITMIKKSTRVKGSGWNVARYVITLIKYDGEGKKVKENVLSGGEPVYTVFFADLKKSGDNLWFIYIEPSQREYIGNIRAVTVNTATLETSEPKILDAESQVNMRLNMFSLSSLHISLLSSPDSSKHCLFIDTDREEFYLSSFDKNFKRLWSGRQTIPGVRAEDVNSVAIDNKGEVFITSIKKGDPFISIFGSLGKAEHKKLNFGAVQPTDIKIYDTDAKGLAVAGVYSGASDNISGVYRATLDRGTFAVDVLARSDFPAPIIDRLGHGFAKSGSKKFGIVRDYMVCDILERKNSGPVLVIECKRWHPAPNAFASFVGNLITATFTDAGIVFSDVPRDGLVPVRVVDPQYYAAACKDDIMLFYLDHESNLEKNMDQEPTLLNGDKDAVLVAAYLGIDGKIAKRVKVSSAGMRVSEGISNYLANECKGR